MNILKIFSRRKVYESIKQLPIAIWWEITHEGKLERLAIKGEYSENELYNCYLNLLQEYYDEFGISEQYEVFMTAKLNYAKKLAQYIIEQKGASKMYLEMAKIEMNDLAPKKIDEKQKRKLYDHIAEIEKVFTGCEKDEEKLTTHKFYTYQKTL